MAQAAIRTQYDDGTVVLSNIRKKKNIPVIGLNDTYTATKVTHWFDGSVLDDSKIDGIIYLKNRQTNEYFKVNLPNDGELFLEKDTVAQLRNMSAVEILLLRMGYYKGVTLSGYYSKGDTPNPIQYYLSDTTEDDDGGSVFVVGGIKLEHTFVSEIDVRYFGVTENNEDNSVNLQNIFDKLDKYSHIVFSDIEVKFSNKLFIDNKSNFIIDFVNSSMYDNAKVLPTTSGGTPELTTRVPNGILINNCKDYVVNGIVLNSECFESGSVSPSSVNDRFPHLEIRDCSNYIFNAPQTRGRVGGFIPMAAANSVYDIMRACFFLQINCINGVINGFNISKDSGGGEFICLTDCSNIRINNTSHYQEGSATTFWSLGKIIKCNDITVDGVDLQSNSPGSLWDVAGENITLRNMYVDYPNGKLVDITHEWEELGIDTKNILIQNVITNGVVCITAGHPNDDILESVRFDNVLSTKEGVDDIYNLRSIDKVIISNTKFNNNQSIIRHYPIQNTANRYKEIILDNCDVTFTPPSISDLSVISVFGKLTWSNSKFGNPTNALGIRLIDSYAWDNDLTDLTHGGGISLFQNCDFRNMTLSLSINTVFVNCRFYNCRFYNNSGQFNNVTIRWVDCNIEYTNNSPLVSEFDRWFEFRDDLVTNLVFTNTNFIGELNNPTGVAFFNRFASSGSNIELINCKWSVNRVGGGSFALFSSNESTHMSIKIIGGIFNSLNVTSLGGGNSNVNTSPIVITVIGAEFNNNFISIQGSNNTTVNNKIRISVLSINANQTFLNSLYNISNQFNLSKFDFSSIPNGSLTVKGLVNQSTAVANITTVDATDEATAITLANANKAKINQLLASLRTAGILAT